MIEHNEFQEALMDELKELEKLQEKLTIALKSAPDGSLHILKKQGKAPQYYLYESGKKRTYIAKKNMAVAGRLAQKEYQRKLLVQVTERIQNGREMAKAYKRPLNTVYEKMSETKKQLITPFELSEEEYVKRWYEENLGCKNTYPINTNIYSNKGIHVRSKSEKILADLFEKNNIPYIYEPGLNLKKGGTVYPDFLVLNRRLRKTFIYEHFGLMSDEQYVDRTVEKMSLYMKNDYWYGINFLFSMESQNAPLDTRNIEKMIARYLQ